LTIIIIIIIIINLILRCSSSVIAEPLVLASCSAKLVKFWPHSFSNDHPTDVSVGPYVNLCLRKKCTNFETL